VKINGFTDQDSVVFLHNSFIIIELIIMMLYFVFLTQ
jgi:hypothetical protein